MELTAPGRRVGPPGGEGRRRRGKSPARGRRRVPATLGNDPRPGPWVAAARGANRQSRRQLSGEWFFSRAFPVAPAVAGFAGGTGGAGGIGGRVFLEGGRVGGQRGRRSRRRTLAGGRPAPKSNFPPPALRIWDGQLPHLNRARRRRVFGRRRRPRPDGPQAWGSCRHNQ